MTTVTKFKGIKYGALARLLTGIRMILVTKMIIQIIIITL